MEAEVDTIPTSYELLEMIEGKGGGFLDVFDEEVVGGVARCLEGLWEKRGVEGDGGVVMREELLREWVAGLRLASFKYRSKLTGPRNGLGALKQKLHEEKFTKPSLYIKVCEWQDRTPYMHPSPKHVSIAPDFMYVDRSRDNYHLLPFRGSVLYPPCTTVQLRCLMYQRWASIVDAPDLCAYVRYCQIHSYIPTVIADVVPNEEVEEDCPFLQTGKGLVRAARFERLERLKRKRPEEGLGEVLKGTLRADGGLTMDADFTIPDHTEDNEAGDVVESNYPDIDLTDADADLEDLPLTFQVPEYIPPERAITKLSPTGSGLIVVPIPDGVQPLSTFSHTVQVPQHRLCFTFSPRVGPYVSTEGTRNWAEIIATYTIAPYTKRKLPYSPDGRTPWTLTSILLRLRQERDHLTDPPNILELEIPRGSIIYPLRPEGKK